LSVLKCNKNVPEIELLFLFNIQWHQITVIWSFRTHQLAKLPIFDFKVSKNIQSVIFQQFKNEIPISLHFPANFKNFFWIFDYFE
jgi:hypothetical protein